MESVPYWREESSLAHSGKKVRTLTKLKKQTNKPKPTNQPKSRPRPPLAVAAHSPTQRALPATRFHVCSLPLAAFFSVPISLLCSFLCPRFPFTSG